MNIYTKNDYREILENVVSERKKLDPSINFQQMAEVARIPKSYLSRVIHGKADLNSDQLYLVCRYLDFDERESAYMQLILEFARTALKPRKEQLLREIRKTQAIHLDTRKHIKAAAASDNVADFAPYYLDPLNQLIHIGLAIPRYQKNLHLLAEDLNVTPGKLLSAINKLEQLRIIERTNDSIKLLIENVHLPKQSPVYKSWLNQLKIMAMNRLNYSSEDHSYSFSVVFSANEEIRREMQSRFLEYLKSVEALVSSSPQVFSAFLPYKARSC